MELPDADVVVLRHGDVGVKSDRVQSWMEQILAENLRAALKTRGVDASVENEWSRLYVWTDQIDRAAAIAKDVFGVVSASPAIAVEADLEAISETLARVAEVTYDGGSFAVEANRAGEHDFTSQDVGEVGGRAIWEEVEDDFEPRVDLDDPDHRFEVDVRDTRAYVFRERIRGPGGLPLGTQDSLLALVSGGIDSPVAAWRVMKRGAPVVPLYLDLGPFGGIDHRARAIETVRALAEYAPEGELSLQEVPIGEPLERIAERVGDTRMLTVRRFMLQIANRVAEAEGAKGIVTGEAIGQKSSQTVSNLAVTDRASDLPVHRPLLAADKQEIVAMARGIGTYDTSTIEAGCNRIAPDQPATRASVDRVMGAEPDDLADWAVTAAANRRTHTVRAEFEDP